MEKITTEFITLQQFLKMNDLIFSGGEAKYFVKENRILVNGETEDRRGRKLYPGDEVSVNGKKYRISYLPLLEKRKQFLFPLFLIPKSR